jgi:vacuolar-type H+-ATPase subunit E/Vma4
MNTLDDDKKALLLSLEADARSDAEKVLAEARKATDDRRAYVEKQAASILAEARAKADAQAAAIRTSILSSVNIEIRRNSMKMQEDVIREVLRRVESEMAGRLPAPAYRDILVAWIAEAALGLGAPKALVNASAPEKRLLDRQILALASKRASSLAGQSTEIVLDDASPLASQGVLVTAGDGRTAYNNQVKTRIMRKKTEIRNLIHDELFADAAPGVGDGAA